MTEPLKPSGAGPSPTRARLNASAHELLKSGLAVGAVGVVGAALGAACPLCVIATPALLGAGAIQKIRAVRLKTRAARVEVAPLQEIAP